MCYVLCEVCPDYVIFVDAEVGAEKKEVIQTLQRYENSWLIFKLR